MCNELNGWTMMFSQQTWTNFILKYNLIKEIQKARTKPKKKKKKKKKKEKKSTLLQYETTCF